MLFKPFDADTHFYETEDCFTRHIDPKHRDLAINFKVVDGVKGMYAGERQCAFLEDPAWDLIEPAGSLAEMLKRGVHASKAGEGKIVPPPSYREDRDARVELIDEQGVDGTILLPTTGITVEHFIRDNPVQTYANLKAYNSWQDEQWGFNYKGKIFCVAMLSLIDVDMAIEELERVMKMGAKAIHLRPGPQNGKSPADPCFDPFWERVNEAKMPVAFHISESGYNELYSTMWGEEPNPHSHKQSAFQWVCSFGDKPMIDTMASLIFFNFFTRFPNIKCLSVENGSLWVGYLLKAMDKMKGMGRQGPWPGGYVKGRPSDIFREHVYVSPYFEEDLVALTELIGTDRVVYGSDFPHPEGILHPDEFRNKLSSLPNDKQEDIMGNNIRKMLGVAA